MEISDAWYKKTDVVIYKKSLLLQFNQCNKWGGEMDVNALKYLNFSETRLQIQKNYGVVDKEWQILRIITKVYICNDPPIRVRNLIDLSEIASPATIHKTMKSLISKGLVKLIADEFDGRIKYLEPTSRAIKLFNEIGKKMQ